MLTINTTRFTPYSLRLLLLLLPKAPVPHQAATFQQTHQLTILLGPRAVKKFLQNRQDPLPQMLSAQPPRKPAPANQEAVQAAQGRLTNRMPIVQKTVHTAQGRCRDLTGMNTCYIPMITNRFPLWGLYWELMNDTLTVRLIPVRNALQIPYYH